MNKSVRRFFSEELLLSASVLFLPILYMTAALALLSGIGLGRWVFPTGLLLWGASVVALHERERWQRLLATLLLLLAAFALAAWALSFVLDRGWDPRTYHAQAILELLKGVNPYHYPADWKTYTYPAAHWLLSSSFVLWTRIIRRRALPSRLLPLWRRFCAQGAFWQRYRICRVVGAMFWRSLLAANPIAALCFFTHNNDGLLASTLLSVFFLMLSFVVEDATQGRTTRLRVAFYVVALARASSSTSSSPGSSTAASWG